MKSVMQHNFSHIPPPQIQRSNFNRSYGHKTTFDPDILYPFLVDEVLPGDTFKVRASMFARLNTPIVPILDNLYLDTFYFFVPYRLVWDNWQRFNGEQISPSDSTDFLVPQITGLNTAALRSAVTTDPRSTPSRVWGIYDHMGIPVAENLSVSALPFRAYRLIWNEWFRDENLVDPATFSTGDGPDSSATQVLLFRGKRHDYFTSCLPWPQKGPGVEIPILADGTLTAQSIRIGGISADSLNFIGNPSGASDILLQPSGAYVSSDLPSVTQTIVGLSTTGTDLNTVLLDNVNLSSTTAVTINDLRTAFQLQRMQERDARGGTRYTEILRSHFGVISPDARLQRPEYLGGGTTRINITQVPQTSATDSQSPQGNLAAYGTIAGQSGFTKSFVEHGIVIGLMNVRADLTYQAGLERFWSRRTRYDFYWPTLAHLGEQAVLNKEIYANQSVETQDDVFGYQERYAEYRYKPSQITGKFRSSDPNTLDVWHLSQHFTTSPSLSRPFIESNTPISRVVAVPSEPTFLLDSYIEMYCTRPMPVYGVPGLIDHF